MNPLPDVAAVTTAPVYNAEPPYHPAERHPELRFRDVSSTPNPAYGALRRLLLDLGLDAGRAGTAEWNPLSEIVRPGDTVLIKPNFVASRHPAGGDLFAVVTHPSILRALIDYVHLALGGRGRIVVADAPEMGCQWDALMAAQRLDAVQAWYRERFGFAIELRDLRDFEVRDPGRPPYAANRTPRPGDPEGATLVGLGRRSEFHGMDSDRFYGADYDRKETIRHHHGDVQEYGIANTFLRADVVISVPKMKVHKKVGVTLNVKGFVGVAANKNCLVHYRLGPPSRNGDQMPDGLPADDRAALGVQRWLYDHALARRSRAGDALYAACRAAYRLLVKPFRAVSREARLYDGGNWHGNDSAWRMAADLAKIAFFADRQGVLQTAPQRRMFCVVDGVIGGENEGPLSPDAKPAGCLVAGRNPLAVDLVATRLMGFDFRRLKQFSVIGRGDWDFGFRDAAALELRVDGRPVPAAEFFRASWPCPVPAFVPHAGWRGHIELTPKETAR